MSRKIQENQATYQGFKFHGLELYNVLNPYTDKEIGVYQYSRSKHQCAFENKIVTGVFYCLLTKKERANKTIVQERINNSSVCAYCAPKAGI